MTSNNEKNGCSAEEKTELYLDGLLNAQETAEFLNSDVGKQVLKQESELQASIDDAILRMFSGSGFDGGLVAMLAKIDSGEVQIDPEIAAGVDDTQHVVPRTPAEPPLAEVKSARFVWWKLAVAAGLLVTLTAGFLLYGNQDGPGAVAFQHAKATDVYQEAVDNKFLPNYNCNNPGHLANFLRQRQGREMEIAPDLPSDRRMLGLSFIGGLSAHCTTMLCDVQGRQVIVLIDREEHFNVSLTTADGESGLNTFVIKKGGLIFCEVTPLEGAMMIDYLTFPDEK